MKIKDYNIIATEVSKQLALDDYTISYLMSVEEIQLLIFNIYITADSGKAHASDFNLDTGKLSFIWTDSKLSIILDKQATRRTVDYLCLYESLTDDIANILGLIQLSFEVL